MRIWPVQDAKARFSELLDMCVKEGPQLVTKRGLGMAVLVPIKDWNRMCQSAKPSLKSLLLSDAARVELEMPDRGKLKRRLRTGL